jgi:hypothetical protein
MNEACREDDTSTELLNQGKDQPSDIDPEKRFHHQRRINSCFWLVYDVMKEES